MDIPTYAIRHGKCGKWWTGAQRAHCGACHETFSSLGAFDRHQTWPRGSSGSGCRRPGEVGLTSSARPFGELWSYPSSDRAFNRGEEK